jgi:hypothetical protein
MVWRKISAGMLMVVSVFSFGLSRQANAELVLSMEPDRLQAYYDHASLFPFTGWVERTDLNGDIQRSSFVLVAPRLALYAGHVAAVAVPGSPITFGLGSNSLTNRGPTSQSSEWYLHPTYQSAGAGYDLAVAILDTPFLNMPTAPLFEGDLTLGMGIHLTGYGRTGLAGTPTENLIYDGNRYAGVGTIDNFPFSSSVHFQSRFWDPLLRPDNSLGIRGTPGSSGGGIYTEVDIFDENGEFLRTEFQLIGLHSYGSTNNLFNSSSFPSMIDVGWVNHHIAKSSVPEPSSAIMAIVGFSALLARRRRRVDW